MLIEVALAQHNRSEQVPFVMIARHTEPRRKKLKMKYLLILKTDSKLI